MWKEGEKKKMIVFLKRKKQPFLSLSLKSEEDELQYSSLVAYLYTKAKVQIRWHNHSGSV